MPHHRHHSNSISSKRSAKSGSLRDVTGSTLGNRQEAKGAASLTTSLAEDLPGGQSDVAPKPGVEATRSARRLRRRGLEVRPAAASGSSESTAQRHHDRDLTPSPDTVITRLLESTASDQTLFVTPGPSSPAIGRRRAEAGYGSRRALAISSSSSEPRRTFLSPSGAKAAAALAAAASYAPFVGIAAYGTVTGGAQADGGEAAAGQDTVGAAVAGGTDSQLPDTGASVSRPYRPRGLSHVPPLMRLFDLLSQLDCFWLAQDLFSGDTQRVQSSVRVLATVALLLLVLWLAAVPNSAEKARQLSFLCAMLLVLTMEECGLSTRLALLILSHTGHKINSLRLHFNVLVCPQTGLPDSGQHPCPGTSPSSVPMHQSMESSERLSYFAYRRYIFSECTTYIRDERNTLFKAMMAAVVYGSNIGSSGTPRGSQQGYYLLHFLRQTYKGATTLNYATWTAYSAPSVVASAVFLWWHLCRRWVPRAHKSYETAAIIMMVAYVNCSLVGQDWININDVTSSVRSETVMAGLTSLAFMVPARRSRSSLNAGALSTEVIQTRMPWGVFLLAGAGCAMTLCFKLGEVSALRLELVSAAADLHPGLGVALLFTLQSFLVEMNSSHDSVLHLMAPMATMASESQWNPLLLLLPVTKGASLVFLLPVSSYGNALLFDYARMSCWEMIKIGFPVKIVTIVLELISLVTVGNAMFDLGNIPAWATQSPPMTAVSAFNATALDVLNITSAA
ncbi:hypothetical protein HPB50_006020 [Hyalomma asiaticum]|uniref:Uncharacterized protein n=1 Tax=Hyalomma asiaticum TaxID=266040 RepID=A0ACB7SN39_HYAAI|nr:hypothetical protein HPB50_006020 [Hyalomma asiaticum]